MTTTTNAKQWIKSQMEEQELPSGNMAKLRKVDLLDLLAQGKIPDVLTGQVEQILSKEKGKASLSLEQFKEFAELLNIVALVTFVEPELVAGEPDEDLEANKLWVGRISATDRIFVFEWANGDAKRVEPFRPKQAGDVENLQSGDDVPPASVKPGGDK